MTLESKSWGREGEKKNRQKRGKKRNEKVNDNAGFSFLCSQRNSVCSKWEVICQAWDTVFHHQMQLQEESWKYDAQRSISDGLRGVLSGDEYCVKCLVFLPNTH